MSSAVNPIIQRELVSFLRTRRALYIQVGLALVLAALVLLRWPADAQADQSGEQARQVFRLFAYGLLVGVVFLAPVLPAASIVREKRSGTLALLLNTPLTRANILLGKLLGALGYALILLLVSLPAAAACFAMGGIALGSGLFAAYGVLLLAALQFATFALWVSSRARSVDTALRMTYAGVLAMVLLPLGPHQFMQGYVGPMLGAFLDWLRCLSPVPAMMDILGQAGFTSAGTATLDHPAIRYAVLASGCIALFAGLTAWSLSRRLLDRPRATGAITNERSTSIRAYRRVMYLWFFDPQRRSRAIGPLTNPVMVKEFRCSRFGRSHWMMRLIGLCCIASLGLMLIATRNSTWGVRKLGGIMVLLQVALIIFMAPSLAAGIISSERETGGWNLLKMTPLSPLTIVGGKLLAVARTLLLLGVATLPGYVVILAFDTLGHAGNVPAVLVTLVLTTVFAVLASAAISSCFRRTAPATAASFSLLLLLCFGTMFVWLGRDAPFAHSTVQAVLQVNPLAAALSAMQAPGFADERLLPATWYILGGLSAVAALVLLVQTWRLTRPE